MTYVRTRVALAVVLVVQGGTRQSSEQCLSGDSYFTLELDNRYNIWFTQWGA